MSFTSNQKGSGHLVLLLLVIVASGIGLVGYRVVKNNAKKVVTSSVVKSAVAVPAAITNKTQAAQAAKALDSEAIDTTLDSSQLDTALNSVL
jgi:uncharacterized protein HemX